MKLSLRTCATALRRRARMVAGVGLALVIAGTSLGIGSLHSGYTADIKNASSSSGFGTGTAFATVKDSGGASLCSSVPSGTTIPATNTFACSGAPIPATATASVQSMSVTLAHSGTQGFAGAGVGSGVCYPRAFANSVAAGNPLLLRYGVTSNQAGPTQLSGSNSALFDGSTGQATANVAFTNPQTYTVGAWFKTSAKRGTIIGFSSTADASGVNNYDRLLFIDNTGNVVWDTVPGGGVSNVNDIASSGTNYADGNWHFALGVAQAGNPSSSISLYVDGVLANSKTINQTISSEVYDGYWRIGYSPQDSRANSGGVYFSGNISNVAYLPSALSAEQVTSLWQSGSQSAYKTNLTNLGATAHWPVGAESTYSGTFAGGNNPCATVDLYTQGAIVGTLAARASKSIAPLGVGENQNVSIGVATNGNYNSFAAGLHLDVQIGVAESGFSQTFFWLHALTVVR